MDDLKSISISVAGRQYPVKIGLDEEPLIRSIEKKVNDQIKQFQNNYSNIDPLDSLSMTLLTYAFDLQKANHLSEDQKLHQRLDELQAALDQALL